ncbi:MAG: PQQ-dependent sugar dehydrogenase [Myxococcales bacterium]|nr:PQQ-dependent sugar dehydrogenase [Myxococcales bacterium]
MTRALSWSVLAVIVLAAACKSSEAEPPRPPDAPEPPRITPPEEVFEIEELGRFEEAWAMTFLPDGRLLITEKPGRLELVDLEADRIVEVAGVPEVAYGGQGGLGDVVLHPDFADEPRLYLSYAEPGEGGRGAAVARALLRETDDGAMLEALEVIWRQTPKDPGQGHFSHRIVLRDGRMWISSGDRQLFTPAQEFTNNLGKIIRLFDDGRVPDDNPFRERGGVAREFWTMGHRNVLGLAFDAEGRLWAHEMGPRGGDELNLIEPGKNYGWPEVSEGRHYDLRDIPSHSTRPEFQAPVVAWDPVISPAGFVIYQGDRFPGFRGDGFIGGLSSEALIRVRFDGEKAHEAERYPMGKRIREVEEGPDGALYLLEDGDSRLLRLTPKR